MVFLYQEKQLREVGILNLESSNYLGTLRGQAVRCGRLTSAFCGYCRKKLHDHVQKFNFRVWSLTSAIRQYFSRQHSLGQCKTSEETFCIVLNIICVRNSQSLHKYISFEPTYIHVQEPGVQTVTNGEGPYTNISLRVRENRRSPPEHRSHRSRCSTLRRAQCHGLCILRINAFTHVGTSRCLRNERP